MAFSCDVRGQAPVAIKKPSESEKASGPSTAEQPSAEAWNRIQQRLDIIDQKLNTDQLESRLAAIEKAIADLKRSSLLMSLLPAAIAALAGILGAFIGGSVNERLQRKRLTGEAAMAETKARHERELAEKQAKLQIGNAVVEWQLKQLYLLYGPVRALLGQSFGLYSQMNKVLLQMKPGQFRFVKVNNPEQNAQQSEEFQIRIGEEWQRFRTVMHIGHVYGRDLGVETYFDEIVEIGKRVVSIIEQHAGYARPEEKDLMSVFARYLAHFAVLKHLHAVARGSLTKSRSVSESLMQNDAIQPLKVDLSAVFPLELHTLIDEGFDGINRDIQEWRRRALA